MVVGTQGACYISAQAAYVVCLRIIPVRAFASNLVLTRTYVRYGLSLLGAYVILYGLTQWLEAAHSLSAYEADSALIPMGVLSGVTARIVSQHMRLRLPLTVSALIMLADAVSMLFLTRSDFFSWPERAPLSGWRVVVAVAPREGNDGSFREDEREFHTVLEYA
jgi:hypothetical protein